MKTFSFLLRATLCCLFIFLVGCTTTPKSEAQQLRAEYNSQSRQFLEEAWAAQRDEALFLALTDKIKNMSVPSWETKQFIALKALGRPDRSNLISAPQFASYALPDGRSATVVFKNGGKRIDAFIDSASPAAPEQVLPKQQVFPDLPVPTAQDVPPSLEANRWQAQEISPDPYEFNADDLPPEPMRSIDPPPLDLDITEPIVGEWVPVRPL